MTGTDGVGQRSSGSPCPRWADRIREPLLVGLCAGIAYFVLGLVLFFPWEELGLIGSGLLKANLFMYSLSVWVCGFTALCGILEIIMLPLSCLPAAAKRGGLKRFVLFSAVIMVFVTGHVVWAYYVHIPPFRPHHIILRDIKLILLGLVLSSALLGLAASLAGGSARVRRLFAGRCSVGPALAVVGFCLVYAIASNLAGMGGRRGDKGEGQPSAVSKPIVMFGIDCGSWNVMLPLLENGDLPGFERLMREGSYGYLDAYGIAGRELTPPSWTTIATGKHREKHGISEFGQLSSEWRAAPIWTILSRAGKRVGVVDWVCAWPPFKVNGMFVANASPSRVGRTYFSPGYDSLGVVADSIIAGSYRNVSAGEETVIGSPGSDVGFITHRELAASAQNEFNFISRIENEVFSRRPLDFVSYYCYCTDMVHHRFWGGTVSSSSGRADRGDRRPDSAGVDMVRWVWMTADTFLTNLMARYGDDAYYLVVSDHGARPVERRMAIFGMSALLREMGYLRLNGAEIDSSASVCLVTGAFYSYSRFHLTVNADRYGDAGRDRAASPAEVKSRIAEELRSIRVKETGRPIFERVDVGSTPGSGDEPDITVFAGKDILGMPDEEKTIVVAGKEVALETLLSPHPWLAHHRARGIILAKGPGVRQRYCGSWMIQDPYALIFPYLREIVWLTAPLDPVLRTAHILDRATTADVAPTLLYLADLPVAEDMDGRVLTEIIDGGVLKGRPIRKVTTYGVGSVVDVNTSTIDREEVKKALKALGYLQ